MPQATTNYSEANILELKKVYDPKADDATRKEQLEQLAVSTSHSVQSVRMKLAQLSLYKKNTVKTTVKKEKQATRDELLSDVSELLKVDESDLEGLQRANRSALVNLIAAVDKLKALIPAQAG